MLQIERLLEMKFNVVCWPTTYGRNVGFTKLRIKIKENDRNYR